ncbi:unnamed protein product [Penicillium olsonii]|nr:unnamed protein product [Penicillium olsonii]
MNLDAWLDEDDNFDLINKHNEILEEAAKHEGTAFKQGSLERLNEWFDDRRKEYDYQRWRVALEVTFAPSMYQPCAAPFEDLNKVMVKDLVCGQRSIDSYILVRTVNMAAKLFAMIVIVEDENENCVMLQISVDAFHTHDVHYLPKDAVLIVKQPRVEFVGHKKYEINVHHVSDIMFVAPTDDMVPLNWRKRRFQDASEWSLDKWIDMGEAETSKGEHGFSIEWCDQALKRSPTEEDANLIYALRSNGNYAAYRYDAALADLEKALEIPGFTEEVLRRKASALYKSRSFKECIETFHQLLRKYPGHRNDIKGLAMAYRRLFEQTHGTYDFRAMQIGAATSETLVLDHATYTGPVAVKESEIHGKGLFTTRDVKFGELLLCEKAFAFIFEGPDSRKIPDENAQKFIRARYLDTARVNVETRTVARGPLLDLATQVITKMHKNPSLRSQVTNLYAGNLPGLQPGDDNSVNSFQVLQAILVNGFGSPMTSKTIHAINVDDRRTLHDFSCHGLWTKASYINHSCVGNVHRAFVGDMMIVRAAQDIPAGTECKFWYTVPAKNRATDTRPWGFECRCITCVDARETPWEVRRSRGQLRKEAWRLINGNKTIEYDDLEEKLRSLEGTFSKPALEVPRFALWDLQFEAARKMGKMGHSSQAIYWGLEGFKSCGFIIEGYEPRGTELVVKKWGVVTDEQVEVWVTLFLAMGCVAPELAPSAEKYARQTFMLCVGEEVSFDLFCGSKSGRFWPLTDFELKVNW